MLESGEHGIEAGREIAATAERPVLCPYCGGAAVGGRCAACGGMLEPLSMQATQNEMGPWFVRDESHPFRPGCSYATMVRLAARGRLTGLTVLRGPTTRQFWSFARNVRGVAHLIGECHNCHGPAGAEDYMCRSCGAVFEPPRDRQHFGVGPVRLLPGHAPPEIVARSVRAAAGSASPMTPPAERAPKLDAGSRAHRPSNSAQREDAAIRRIHRESKRLRRLVAASIAANIVLLAVLVVASMSQKFSIGGRPASVTKDESQSAPPTAADAGARGIAADATRVEVRETAPIAAIEAAIEEARRLIRVGTLESLRQAERTLEGVAADGSAPTDLRDSAAALLEETRALLDRRALERVVSPPVDGGK